MVDDVLIAKAETIERCIKRIHEEYRNQPENIYTNYTTQDSILVNIERICQAAIDMAMRLVRLKKLGIPKETRDAFDLLSTHHIIEPALNETLKRMVGFRNIAIHEYQKINLSIVEHIIHKELQHVQTFAQLAIQTK